MTPVEDLISEVKNESKEIVEEFIKTEVELEPDLPQDGVKAFEEILTTRPEAMGKEYGKKLREIAVAFQNSSERKKVHETAERAPLNVLERETFSWMFAEIFSESYDMEGVCVLMFFLRDLIVRCIKERLGRLGASILQWGVEFLQQRIAPWVAKCGGWGVVMVKHTARSVFSGPNLALAGAAVLVVGLGIMCYEKIKTT